MKFTIFSTYGVSGVKNFKCVFWIFVLWCGVISLISWLFLWSVLCG